MFFAQADRLGDRALLWAKDNGRYRPLSWRETADRICRLAEGLKALGIRAGDRVVLVAENRPEWLIADFAIMAVGAVTVPAYTTNAEADHLYIFDHSGARAVITSTGKLAQRVMTAAGRASALEIAVVISVPAATALPPSLTVASWQEVMAPADAGNHARLLAEVEKIGSDQLACIIYTSGTGGAPKGVMLHHGAILHNCAGAAAVLRKLSGHRGSNEVFLSLLPLSHAYEHTVGQFLPIAIGAQIYYAESIDKVLSNIQEARPTILSAVPRFYEILHQRLLQGARKAKPLQQRLFEAAVTLGQQRYHGQTPWSLPTRIFDRILELVVRRSIRKRFGGRIRALVSGGAPLNVEIGIALRAMGLPLVQGYGQSEAAPLISVNHPRRVKLHTVGPALQGVTARIAADGELVVRGAMVMQGYWRNPEATAEALRDGWLHTGDIGEIDADGDIIITDRKKDIIVNSGGDNLSPARIEALLMSCPEIAQAMVYGDRRPHLVALIVADPEWARKWAAAAGKADDPATLASNADFCRALTVAVDRVNTTLSVIERIRRIAVAGEPFSIENGLLTPTLKIRRHIVRKVYGSQLDRLYD